MKSTVQKMTAAALAGVMVFAVVMVVRLAGQAQSQVIGDFRNAAVAEIRDGQGKVLLRGTFAPVDSDDDAEVERLAPLAVVDTGMKLTGEAEVEYQKDTPDVQEVEFLVTGAPSGASLTLFIDGKSVVSATADGKGRAEAEVAVRAKGN